jgi:hypothetical protein
MASSELALVTDPDVDCSRILVSLLSRGTDSYRLAHTKSRLPEQH